MEKVRDNSGGLRSLPLLESESTLRTVLPLTGCQTGLTTLTNRPVSQIGAKASHK